MHHAVCGPLLPKFIGEWPKVGFDIRDGHDLLKQRLRQPGDVVAGDVLGFFPCGP
jgi:hypothetical protein